MRASDAAAPRDPRNLRVDPRPRRCEGAHVAPGASRPRSSSASTVSRRPSSSVACGRGGSQLTPYRRWRPGPVPGTIRHAARERVGFAESGRAECPAGGQRITPRERGPSTCAQALPGECAGRRRGRGGDTLKGPDATLNSCQASTIMASTIDKYLAQIAHVATAAGMYAYRGQHDSRWQLYSAATRRLIAEHSSNVVLTPDFSALYINYHRDVLLEPARMRGFGFQSGRRLSDLELLSILQHFGAATGLLDFTWSPLVALWFASKDPTCDGQLFAINTNDAIRVSKVSGDDAAQSVTHVLSGGDGPPHLSYWEPMVTDDASTRILRQRSVFIIGRPLLPVAPEIISTILVAKDDKAPLTRELAVLDFHEDSLFQDVYGFAQASNRRPVPTLTAEAYRNRGNRYYQQGEYAEAIVAYGQSIGLAQNVGLTYLLRANALAAAGNHQDAVRDYDKAEAQRIPLQHLQAVYFNRGNSKVGIADYESAIQDYTTAIKKNGDNSASYYNRGNAYADLDRYKEAVLDYDRVTGHSAAHAAFNKGNALLAMGRLPEAEDCYRDAVAKDANHGDLTQNLWTLEQIRTVVEEWQYTIRAAPDSNTGRMCLRFEGSKEAAKAGGHLERFFFFGRAGNTGNIGGPGLSGGAGFEGKRPIHIHVVAVGTEDPA